MRAFVSPAGQGLGFDLVGSAGRLVLVNDGADTQLWTSAEAGAPLTMRKLSFPPPPPAGPLAVADLVGAIERGTPTGADLQVARRATEIGFAVHQSHREGGRRIAPSAIDPDLRIASLPWGNE